MTSSWAWDAGAGLLAGYVGSRAMDQATTWYWGRMSERAKAREVEANPEGTPLTVGRTVAVRLGRGSDEGTARATAAQLHRGLGLAYGVLAARLVRSGLPPVTAGVVTGAAAFVLVDEAATSAVLPAPWTYPLESHVRGAIGHLTLGTVVGIVLAVWRQVAGTPAPRRAAAPSMSASG